MKYAASTTITGSPEIALARIRDALLANGFTITTARSTELTTTGPGMMSNKENPIRGVSAATFLTQGGQLHVTAELGGAAFLGRFAIYFPLGLGLFFVILFGWGRFSSGPAGILTPLLSVAPWLILGPLIARMIRKRTEKAIDALLQGAAITS
jgi:hypothetical protein